MSFFKRQAVICSLLLCHGMVLVDMGIIALKMEEPSEKARLEAVHRYLDIDFNRNAEFQSIVDLVAEVCNKPVALITLLDDDLNWIKVKTGVDSAMNAMPRETSFCQYSIIQKELLIIPDAALDPRFNNNPFVTQAPNVRFYAAAPLVIKNELRLGTLCLFDMKPGALSSMQQKVLQALARQVTFLMELEMSNQLLQQQVQAIQSQTASLDKIAHIQSHDIRQPLTSIMGLIGTIKEDGYAVDKERLRMIEEAAHDLDEKVHDIVKLTAIKSQPGAA